VRRAWSGLGLVVLLLCGCQQAAPAPAPARDVASPRMHPAPTGTLAITHGEGGGTAIHFEVTGVQPGSVHPVRVGARGCDPEGKTTVAVVTADETGSISADVSLDPGTGQGPDPFATGALGVELAVGPGDRDPVEAASLACADVGPGRIPRLAPAPAFSATQVSVQMSYDRAARILTVHVKAAGLEPGTRHPNHVHTGQCDSEGPVREVLTTLVADARGVAEATTSIPQSDGIKPGAWYVAVHRGPGLDSQSQYALLACGDVVRAAGDSPPP
jgi:hypothetical protein